MAIDCDHPRPALNLPGYVPARLGWQVPSYIPDLPPSAARVIRDALSGVYQELTRLGQTRNLIPLQESLEARPGSVIAGIGDGQTITLLPPGADGYLDPVSVLLTDVVDPVTVLHPDGTVTTLGEAGSYDFTPASTTEYETNPGGLVVSGGVPTDTLLGRDTAGTGAVEFITVTAPLEFTGAGSVRIATNGIANTHIRQSGALSVIGRASNSTGDVADISGTASSDAVLRISGTTLGFGTVATAGIANDAVTNAKLRDSGALSVIGRSVNSSGDPADISATAGSDAVLRESGSTIGFGTIATAGLADDSVTNAKLANMPANTVKVNPTTSTADPTDLPMNDLSVLARAGLGGTGNIESFTVPGTGTLTGESVFLRSPSVRTSISWRNITLTDFPLMSDNRFIGNISGATARPIYTDLGSLSSATVSYENVGKTFIREALTGDVTASQNSNATTITNGAVTNAKLRNSDALSVIGNPTNASTVPSDIAAANDAEVLRRSGSTLGFGTIATAGLADDSVTDAKLRNSAALSVIGRAANSTGDPADISAVAASGAVLRESGSTIGFGTVATAGITDDAVTDAKLRNSGALSVIGRSANSSGDPADISATASSDQVLRVSGTTLGFGTVATAGITDDAVTNAKLRNSGALSVIGRSANSSGDPADISATAASDAVLRESGSTIGFGTIATGGIANNAVTNAKLAQVAAGRVKGLQIDASGPADPVDLTGLEVAELLRYGTTQAVTLAATTNDLSLNADTTVLRLTSTTGAQSLTGITGGAQGRLLFVENISADGNPITLTSLDAGSTAGNRFRTPRNLSVIVGFRDTALLRWETNNNDWRVVAVASSPLTDGDKGDITVATSGTVWTIDSGAVTLAKMANLAAGTVIGRQIDASTGVPVALTGAEQGENYRANTRQTVSASGTLDITLNDDTTILVLQLTADATLRSISNTAGGDGRLVRIEHDSGAFTLTIGHNLATPTFFPLFNPGERDMTVRRGATVNVRSRSGFWRPEYPGQRVYARKNSTGTVFERGRLNLIEGSGVTLTVADDATNEEIDVTIAAAVTDGDKGDITVSGSGATFTIDNNVVSDAKLRDSGALSVIGRSANSSGDPADISATAASDAVLRESGSTIGFGTIATGGIANNAVTDAKLRQSAALTVIGRASNSTGDVADIGAGSDGFVLRRSGTALGFGTIATAGIGDDQVSDAKLRNSGALSVIGRSANSSGDPADISATAASDAVLRESGSTLGFGTIATGGIANDAVTDAKLRNSGALSVIGRSANSSGDPADISATASSDQVLRVSGTTLGFGTVATAGIADAAVTLAKMANLAQSTIIGRAESAGTGVPTALTSTQVAAIIDGEPFSWLNDHVFGGSSTRVTGMFRFDGILTTATTAANDLAIGNVNVVRFTGPVSPLTGMVKGGDGQIVALVNAHASSDVVIQLNSPSSTAANTFAGSGTDRHIKPGEMGIAWYDGTSSRWRLLVRDDVDL